MTTDDTETRGGADWEIGEAARKLSEALGVEGAQAEALRLALSDHAAAVGSKSTQMISALFTPVLTQLHEARGNIHQLEIESQNRATYFYNHMGAFLRDADARFKNYDENEQTTIQALTSVARRLDEITSYVQQSVTLAREALDVSKDNARRQEKLEKDVRLLKKAQGQSNKMLGESQQDRRKLHQEVAGVKDDVADLRQEIEALKQARGDNG